jgi:GNAT superfamily N-acetyltransferase
MITVVPANEASWADLQAILGARGPAAQCQCQWLKCTPAEWRAVPAAERAVRLREQTGCGDPGATTTSGLVAYLGTEPAKEALAEEAPAGGKPADREPAGWCAVEPRSAYSHLRGSRVVWAGRAEDRSDDSVWAAVCFITRAGFRRRGVSAALAAETVGFARERGARAIEGYPMITEPGKEITWGELYVGSHSIFADAGYTEISRPTPRRAVMRYDF